MKDFLKVLSIAEIITTIVCIAMFVVSMAELRFVSAFLWLCGAALLFVVYLATKTTYDDFFKMPD